MYFRGEWENEDGAKEEETKQEKPEKDLFPTAIESDEEKELEKKVVKT